MASKIGEINTALAFLDYAFQEFQTILDQIVAIENASNEADESANLSTDLSASFKAFSIATIWSRMSIRIGFFKSSKTVDVPNYIIFLFSQYLKLKGDFNVINTLQKLPLKDQVYHEIYDILGDDDETINNMVLPKGTTCYLCPLATHRDSVSYPYSNSFDPENFDIENIAKRHKKSFIGFSGNPRGCIGSKYTMLSMKVLLSTFLRNFSIHTDYTFNDIKLKLDLLLRSANGYPVTIRRRNRRPINKLND
ncbi:cytochrome P450 4g15-like [Rhopalosiphum maidis]|uniref:cytochrome P450 4g15-like n=1 Tax=Rhopalosiphum maidis TaxID=43146 RepID=UPI000EFFE92A|nr:cytochrome P450 4g15-like [Rhopalosiphum maidis]